MARGVVLPADLTAPSTARRFVDEVLATADTELRMTVRLITSELVTNVVRHTDSEVRLTLDAGPPVRVEVHDGHSATDAFREMLATRPRSADHDSPSGRGLVLVHDLAARVGLNDDPAGGKVVWFEVDC